VGRSVRQHGPVTPCLPRGKSAVCGLQTGRLYLAGGGHDTLLTLLLFSAAAGAAEPLPAESVDPLSMARSRLTCAQQVAHCWPAAAHRAGAYSQPCICAGKGSTTQAPRPNPAGCQQYQSAQAVQRPAHVLLRSSRRCCSSSRRRSNALGSARAGGRSSGGPASAVPPATSAASSRPFTPAVKLTCHATALQH